MPFRLLFTTEAKKQLQQLIDDPSLHKRLKAVSKAIGFLEQNPRHLSLNTHKFTGITGSNGEEIFEAYAENHTPAAYRIFWHYGPGRDIINILAILPHP